MTGEVPPDDKNAPQDGELEPQDDAPAQEVPTSGDAAEDIQADPSATDPYVDEADDDFDDDEYEDEEPEEEPVAPIAPLPTARTAPASSRAKTSVNPPSAVASRSVATEEEIPYIDDRVSKIWVGAIVAIFILILLYGLLFGQAGMFGHQPASPEPEPTDTPVPSLTAAPTSAPTLTLAPTVAPTVAPSVAPTPAPTSVPTPAPSSSPG